MRPIRRLIRYAACLAAAALVLVFPAESQAASPLRRAAARIGAAAYVYGVALLDEQRVIDRFPPNTLISITHLATPAERLVPEPNVDTLYTTARLDLTSGPLVIHVPEEHGRYYTLQLLDAYTNTFAYIGTRVTGTHAGNFALVGPGWHGALPPGVRRIASPTPTVWLLGRTLVKSASDVPAVNRVQHRYTLTPLNRFGGAPLPSVFLASAALTSTPLPSGLAFYDALGAAMAAEPPPASERALLQQFATVGVGPGRAPSTEALPSAVKRGLIAGLTRGQRQIDGYQTQLKVVSESLHNGWLIPPKAAGRYGRDYRLRAYIAENGLGSNVPAEAEYPMAYVDSRLHTLSGRHRYILHFARGQLPPVRAFWSLTVYNRALFLVPNSIHRYAVGDRTPGLRRNRDGSLDIILQPHPPAGGARTNWLPTPRGQFELCLRLYEPKRAAARGAWPLPTITSAR